MNSSKQRKNIRLSAFNYSTDGYYFITNNTDFSKPYIHGRIKNIVHQELVDLEKRFKGVSIYYYSLMPTHIHVILELNNSRVPISEIWRVYKSKSTVFARKIGFSNLKLWQPNYYEHVIRNEKALQRIVKYIQNNPYKENLPFEEIYGDRIPKLVVD